MAMLLKAQFDKTTSPSVQDEIKQNISYYASFYSALPMLKQNLTEKIGPLADNQPIFTLGTWVGGDMDGNPNVTYKTLDMALTQSAIEIARLYRASLKKMSETAETMGLFNVAGAIEELRQTLNTERITKLQNSQILVEHQRGARQHPPTSSAASNRFGLALRTGVSGTALAPSIFTGPARDF
jgi:phosphoenolpyruvate carboxylase